MFAGPASHASPASTIVFPHLMELDDDEEDVLLTDVLTADEEIADALEPAGVPHAKMAWVRHAFAFVPSKYSDPPAPIHAPHSFQFAPPFLHSSGHCCSAHVRNISIAFTFGDPVVVSPPFSQAQIATNSSRIASFTSSPHRGFIFRFHDISFDFAGS